MSALENPAIPTLFMTTPYVRADGLGTAFGDSKTSPANVVAVGLTALLTLLIAGVADCWILLSSAMVFGAARALMCKRLSGTTGDTAGALIEALEIAALITVVGLSA